MESLIKEIIGQEITSAIKIHDYHQLFFKSGAILNIYNPFKISGVENFSLLTNKKVLDYEHTEKEINLKFTDGISMSIDLERYPEDIPESITYLRTDGQFIVEQNK